MEVVIIGTLSKTRDELKPIIEKMGGKLVTKLHPKTAVVLSTQIEVDKMNKRMQEVRMNDIQVCTEDFLDKIKSPEVSTLDYIATNSICDWGSDVSYRCTVQRENLVKYLRSVCSQKLESIKANRSKVC